MSERQTKRLRRAARAYITANRTSLAKGEPVFTAAHKASEVVRRAWPTLNAHERGRAAARLLTWPLTDVALELRFHGRV